MSTRFSLNLSMWIGITVGLYVLLYLMSPLGLLGALPCTFVALPIYLSAGASAKTRRRLPECGGGGGMGDGFYLPGCAICT